MTHRHNLAQPGGAHGLEHGQFARREREISHRAGVLRVAGHLAPVYVDPCAPDTQLARVEVEVAPPQPADLLAAQPKQRKREAPREAVVGQRVEKRRHLLGCPDLALGDGHDDLLRGRVEVLCGIETDPPHTQRVAHHGLDGDDHRRPRLPRRVRRA
ncbi:hypothetical protein [Gordonia sihwensis]|uniref:hypothetical protein n=1 Tax=Gordonia sihwensis TaxID=173559 RepID=UPI001E2B49B2|nr:hypothetical protein [Gordonia sihwensis]